MVFASRFLLAGFFVLSALYPQSSGAIDLGPGGYVVLPAGTNALALYYQRGTRSVQYVNGNEMRSNPEFGSDTVTAKYLHYTRHGERTVAPGFIQTCGRYQAGGDIAALGSTSGCVDPILGAVFWVLDDKARKAYFGISPYVAVPIGSYDRSKALNMGENRWRFGVNSGLSVPLTDEIRFDIVGDIIWHGKNDEYGASGATLEQGAIYNAQLYLSYQFDRGASLSVAYLHDWGGQTTVNGIERSDRKNQGRYRIGGGIFLDPGNQLQLEVGADTQVENGLKEDSRFSLRWLRLF